MTETRSSGASGTPPSEDYLKSLNVLDNVVRECMHISHQHGGRPSRSTQDFYASVLFTALVSRGVSLLSLAPHSPWAAKVIEHWDYATATGVVRTMLELRAAFFYLCIEQCSADEWDCRWNLLNLHDCMSRIRLFTALGVSEEVSAFQNHAELLRKRLRANRHFTQLKQQAKLLNGQIAYLYPIEDLAEKAGIEKRTYRWLHVLFSSHVHGLPMSYYRMADGDAERGRGLPSPVEEHYTALCLSLASALLTGARDELQALFAGLPDE